MELLPMAGGTRVLAVSDDGEHAAWARTIDATGTLGKLRRFEGAHVVTAFEGSDKRTTFVTSDGDRLCVATFRADAEKPDAQGCETTRPEVVVPIGERLALLSLDVKDPPSRPVAKPAARTSGAAKSSKKGAAAKSSTKKGAAAKSGTSTKKSAGKKGGTKKSAGKKSSSGKKKSASVTLRIPSSKAKVDVHVAWATRNGVFEPASVPTGLSFERPLSGMMLADAAPRGAGADLLFYESVARPKKRSKTAFGTARLGVASLGADGSLAAGTRAELMEGDLEYGSITGWNAPRLVVGAAGTALVAFAGRNGPCRAERVLPSLGPSVTSKAGCQVDPLGWSAATTAAAERLLAAQPVRAPGQTKGDAPLAVWAGDRAIFATVDGSGVATTARADGNPTPLASPFSARRSRVAWSAFAPDGEGVAFAAGRVFRIDAAGAAMELLGPQAIDALGTRSAALVRGDAPPEERRRAARIGDHFFLAREDVVRLGSPPVTIEALAGRAHPDATALTGGQVRGALIEVASGVLRVTWIGADGATAAGPSIASPVRAGLDASERAAGGAIVAGVDADDSAKVNAFTFDADGRLGPVRATSLAVPAGAFGVRVTALPGGGALLTDLDRRRAVWLDDDANERGAAALPDEQARTTCLDGRPAPLSVPSPEPGKLVRIAELSVPGTCITGEPAWTVAGGFRWIGARSQGFASLAEVGALDGVVPPVAPRAHAASTPPAAPVGAAPPATTTSPAAATSPAATTASTSPAAATSPAATTASTSPAGAAAPAEATSPATSDGAAVPDGSPTSTTPAAPAAPATSATPAARPSPPSPSPSKPECPSEMVSIAGRFCIDRFEAMLVDAKTQRRLAPDYPPTPNLLEIVLGDWSTDRAHWGDVHARAFPLPPVPEWQRGAKTEPVAVVRFGARPNGHVTGLVAAAACEAAGKRLCTLEEHTTACRGEDDTDFPYGTEYQDGVCNVFRDDHPAAWLHHNASFGHLDPRLNRVRSAGKPLFETAGARPACRSVWGSDAAYDLVGNLDEWVDEGNGAFAGGFYSRSTRAGCDAVITAHPRVYADYSTGIRCCKDAEP